MSAKFFWFLPTNGDSRSIVGASHASSHHTIPDGYRAADPAVSGRGRQGRRPARLRGRADADRNLVRGRLADRLGAARRDRAAEVPGGLPARAGAADAGRPAGGDLPAVLRRPTAAQRGQRRRDSEQRRFGDWLGHDERYARTGEFLQIVKSIWAKESFDFDGEYYTIRDGRVSEPPNPLPQFYFGGSSAAALPIAAEHVDVLPDLGRAAAGRGRQDRPGARARRRARPQPALRHPAAHHHPRHLRRGVGGRRGTGQRAHARPDRGRRPDCTPIRSPRGSAG